MGKVRILSILILLGLGLNILGDALGTFETDHSTSHSSEKSFVYESVDVDHSEQACHFTQCHFGHCAHIQLTDDSSFSTSFRSQQYFGLLPSLHVSPFLEGPKQPPRFRS